MFQSLRDYEEAYVRDIVDFIRSKYPNIKDEITRKRAQQHIVALARLCSMGLLKQISAAVGSPDLTRIYDRLFEKYPTPAVMLIHASLALDHKDSFPEKMIVDMSKELKSNHLAYWNLQSFVLEYFHLFPAPPHVKQRICEKLDVQYKPNRFFDERRKLLSG